jgi:polyisoprenoid-binding protein YceI
VIRRVIAILFFVAAGCSTRLAPTTASAVATTAPAGRMEFSPANTRITFVGSALFNSHEGEFRQFTGRFDCPGDDPTAGHLACRIDMASVETKIPLLTKHLKDSDFFDVAAYPTATFDSTSIRHDADGSDLITGNLRLHGVTHPVSIPAKITEDPATITIEAHFTIRQSDFGMASARTTTDDVPVTVTARLRR